MKNTWLQSKDINERMSNENDTLLYHYLTDSNKFEERLSSIVTAMVNEFWRPEAFTKSEKYCERMMYFKEIVRLSIKTGLQKHMKENYQNEHDIFEFVLLKILSDLELYNELYSDSIMI